MKLNEIFANAPEIEIEQLSSDSRLPMKNAIFFCLNGIKYDGHNFISEAIDNGAKVIIYEKELNSKAKNAIYVKVKNVNDTLYKIADKFYNHPNDNINTYVISGCYGRSSVTSIINNYLNCVSTCGSVGMFGINYSDKHLSIPSPTLTPLENLKTLNTFKNNNVKNAVFESSVISLYYKKLDVIKPDVFIYTNTSRYCADYRACNNNYFENIRRYLYTLEDNTCVLFNYDDESFNELKETVNNYRTYGSNSLADYYFYDIVYSNNKTTFKLSHNNQEYLISTNLLGLQNVYNLVASIAALNISGYDISDIIEKLSNIKHIDGVIEKVDDSLNVIVDCGYEIDSINNMFEYARKVTTGKIICVIGINYSDSDERIKNIMDLCNKYLDVTILTEDESLQGEVMSILSKADKYSILSKVIHVQYRSVAIENAINLMNSNDTLLILGKGNEKYLNMGLGKEKYLGDKHYAIKYISKRKEFENEII